MEDLQKLWFTSDHHFFHDNIIKYQPERDFDSVYKMNEHFIEKWNENVKKDDTVFHLGDLGLGRPDEIYNTIQKLNGKIHYIRGNHEKRTLNKRYIRECFETIEDDHELKVKDPYFKGGSKEIMIVLHHYSKRVWNRSHKGSWHLYGHSHGSLEHTPWGRSMDVGVDNAKKVIGEFRPFNYCEIREIMKKRKIINVDHHK